jgi:phosphatidylinositol-3,4,5-trisphosphate 3-phosphatase and dual-specificity protein phosphatase PTEN
MLLFFGFFDNVDDSLRFYGHRRFTCGKGVSQPCQLRYVYYFEAFYKKQILSPSVKRLRGIQFDKVPNMSSGHCVPFFEVFHC